MDPSQASGQGRGVPRARLGYQLDRFLGLPVLGQAALLMAFALAVAAACGGILLVRNRSGDLGPRGGDEPRSLADGV